MKRFLRFLKGLFCGQGLQRATTWTGGGNESWQVKWFYALFVTVSAFLFVVALSDHSSNPPHNPPQNVSFEICAVTPTVSGPASVKTYATCIRDVSEAWHDEWTWQK